MKSCWDPDPEKRPSMKEVPIYTSRLLSFFISKCSSIYSSKDYISNELDFDIDISRTNALGIKRKIEDINIEFHENSRKSIKISSSYSRTSLTDRK
ncbi:unnamed protein product [Rhizophagus irregularis]|nr:unnamed protein product [Rhizophagus irregularis]CAB5367534.1 unnamed protein product [Rhizophagus irregularis]